MTTLVLTVDRSSLSLSDLSIDDDGFSSYAIDPDGYTEPETRARNTTARSPLVHGELVTGTVLDPGTMFLTVTVIGTTTAVLETRIQALRRALCRQRSYLITRTLDGQSQTWRCQPAAFARTGPILKGEVHAHVATYRVAVPVYPIFGS